MTETHLEAAGLAVIVVAVYAGIQEAVRWLFRRRRAGDEPVTQDDLVKHCARMQATCSATKIVAIIQTNMTEMRAELKAEMSEIRKLVVDVIKER